MTAREPLFVYMGIGDGSGSLHRLTGFVSQDDFTDAHLGVEQLMKSKANFLYAAQASKWPPNITGPILELEVATMSLPFSEGEISVMGLNPQTFAGWTWLGPLADFLELFKPLPQS